MYKRINEEIRQNNDQQSENDTFRLMVPLLLLRRNFGQNRSSCVDLLPIDPVEDMTGHN